MDEASRIGRRLIEVVDYDPGWPEEFMKEAEAIRVLLSGEVVHVHHIGSTAVPGLKAKPVIDIMLEVRDVDALDAYDREMEGLGYLPRGEYGIPGRRYYIKGPYHRTHHIHAFREGSDNVRRHLAFRDYLIAHPSVASEYGELKAGCAASCDNDSEKYCDCKDAFVRFHEKKAQEWMRD